MTRRLNVANSLSFYESLSSNSQPQGQGFLMRVVVVIVENAVLNFTSFCRFEGVIGVIDFVFSKHNHFFTYW